MLGSPRSLSCLVFLCLTFTAYGLAQTSIDDVHVTPRQKTLALNADLAASLPTGAGLIHTRTELVLVPVTITDNYNRPVIGLEQNNFQLFENKSPQAIKHFSAQDTPVSIGIILDVSGSMSYKLEQARDAVAQFCDVANPEDEFFLITFSETPRLDTDFTTDATKLKNNLVMVHSKGRTSLLDAIYMGVRQMRDARYSRRALLILSDGGDNHSRYTERDVKNAIRESDVLVYAVGTYDRYVDSQEERLGPELLHSLTDMTGGQTFALSNEKEMPHVTRMIGTQLRHQYVLAYEPQIKHRDEKWHKISVKLLLPRKLHNYFLHVGARQGYYAGGE
jgi:Ca-activated chloride channel homolog